MSAMEKYITKIKKKLLTDDLEERKILKYLKHLDQLDVDVDTLKNTGIGKTVNGLKKDTGIIGEVAKNLVFKWRTVVNGNQVEIETRESSLVQTSARSSLLNSEIDHKSQQKEKMNERERHRNKKREKHKERKIEKDNHSKMNSKSNVPSLQLCDISFGLELPKDVPKPKKKQKQHHTTSISKDREIYNYNQDFDSTTGHLPPLPSVASVNEALLPDIQPTYKPSRLPNLEDSPSKKKRGDIEGTFVGEIKSRKSKTQVFSGRRTQAACGVVTSLFDSCIRVLIENIDALHETGGVPYYILHPVLIKCSPQQLLHLENCNPDLIEESDELWLGHYRREFKSEKILDGLTWRESYLEKCQDREERLAKINAKISAAQAAKKPERQVKLAYVETQAKPPPQIRRKQARYGTSAHSLEIPMISPVKQSSVHRSSVRSSIASFSMAPAAPTRRPATAPMMKKTIKLLKNQRCLAGSRIKRR